MARVSGIVALEGEPPPHSAQFILHGAADTPKPEITSVVLPLAGLIDMAAERTRLRREQADGEADAQKLRAKLDNGDFVARAKPEVVEETRKRLAAAEATLLRLRAMLSRIE